MTDVLVIDKNGSIKETNVKNYIEKELFKKCGFKKSDGFNKEGEWSIKIDKQSYNILLYGKTTGRANYENKYDFPPPLDNTLFLGLVCLFVLKKTNQFHVTSQQSCGTKYMKNCSEDLKTWLLHRRRMITRLMNLRTYLRNSKQKADT